MDDKDYKNRRAIAFKVEITLHKNRNRLSFKCPEIFCYESQSLLALQE